MQTIRGWWQSMTARNRAIAMVLIAIVILAIIAAGGLAYVPSLIGQ
jgi:hypothetical protein